MTRKKPTQKTATTVTTPVPAGLGMTVPSDEVIPAKTLPAVLPVCPNCQDEHGQHTIVCVATKSETFYTRFACPRNCGFKGKKAREKFKERMERANRQDQQPAVRRPGT